MGRLIVCQPSWTHKRVPSTWAHKMGLIRTGHLQVYIFAKVFNFGGQQYWTTSNLRHLCIECWWYPIISPSWVENNVCITIFSLYTSADPFPKTLDQSNQYPDLCGMRLVSIKIHQSCSLKRTRCLADWYPCISACVERAWNTTAIKPPNAW